MTLDCRGAMSPTRPRNRSGGLERSQGRRRLFKKGRRPRSSNSLEAGMTALRLSEHPRHIDHLRLRDGTTLTVRLVAPDDGEALQRYFRQLSTRSRYSRFLGAMSELP